MTTFWRNVRASDVFKNKLQLLSISASPESINGAIPTVFKDHQTSQTHELPISRISSEKSCEKRIPVHVLNPEEH